MDIDGTAKKGIGATGGVAICRLCGRKLRSAKSIAFGIGPRCSRGRRRRRSRKPDPRQLVLFL